jgi:hypothetical protein
MHGQGFLPGTLTKKMGAAALEEDKLTNKTFCKVFINVLLQLLLFI